MEFSWYSKTPRSLHLWHLCAIVVQNFAGPVRKLAERSPEHGTNARWLNVLGLANETLGAIVRYGKSHDLQANVTCYTASKNSLGNPTGQPSQSVCFAPSAKDSIQYRMGTPLAARTADGHGKREARSHGYQYCTIRERSF